MPAEMLACICTRDQRSIVTQPIRMRIARGLLGRKGKGVVGNALRALKYHLAFCKMQSLPTHPIALDVLAWELEEHRSAAIKSAETRKRKRACEGKTPRRNCRGGKCATGPLRLGFQTLATALGLSIPASDPMIRAIAKAGPGMPAIRSMLPIDLLPILEQITRDTRLSQFERAYAGAGWLMVPAGARTIDFQRTPKLWFEKSDIDGEHTNVACGIARATKGSDMETLQPLAWRAPIIACSASGVDLQPLIDSMPDTEDGCIFRGFEKSSPSAQHVVTNAVAWANQPASHDTIVSSLRAIVTPHIGAERASKCFGHDERHVLAEVGRIARFPKHERETLSYWRPSPTIGQSADDISARARAVAAARIQRSQRSNIAFMSNRYSSVDAEPIEQDSIRAACMHLIARYLKQSGASVSTDTREQLKGIRSMIDQ